MNTATTTVLANLERQLHEVVEKLQLLQQANTELKGALHEAKSKLDKKQEDTRIWKEKYEALKAVQGMNTDNIAAKKRTLHHIDVLINEVDACIAQLKIED